MSIVIASYFVFVVCSLIFIAFHIRHELKADPWGDEDNVLVIKVLFVIFALSAFFSVLSYQFYTL